MNILYHHRTQAKGVEGVHINEIVKALVGLGNHVDVVSPAGINQEKSDKNAKPNRVYEFISNFMPEIFFEKLEILYNFLASRKIERLLKEKKYDLIYERYAIFNWAGVRCAKKNKIPIILEVNYTSFTPLYRKRSAILKPLAHWLDKHLFKDADGLVVVSTYLKNHLINLGVDEKKIIVLTNAADPIKFNPHLSGEKIRVKYNLGGNKIVGFIGGFYPWHGLDMLLDSFLILKYKNMKTTLMLIGDGPIKVQLQNKVKDLHLENDVIFVGQIKHDNLPDYIAAFDVAVMPDSNNYGSPMKIYEYMAMGKPVVAPRLGPLEDGVTDGREGFLFTKSDKNGLSNALKKLLSDDAIRSQMGECARKKILSSHTWHKNCEAILMLYSGIKNNSLKVI